MFGSVRTNDHLIYKNDDDMKVGQKPGVILNNLHDVRYGGEPIINNDGVFQHGPNAVWQDKNKIGAIAMTNEYLYIDQPFGTQKPFTHSKVTPVPTRTNYTQNKYNTYW